MKQQLDEYVKDDGCVGNCTKLRWNRKRLGLTQKQFAKKVGLCEMTISKLERDETAWATLQDSTVDKIMSFYSSMSSWQPERADKVIREINKTVKTSKVEEEVIMDAPAVFAQVKAKPVERGLNKQDEKTLTLIEFAYEELTQAKTHEEFVDAIQMLRKIMNRY